jgi:hypothetical protein
VFVLMRNLKVKTDEQIIETVNQYIEKYPNASRNQIVLHATGNGERVRGLAKKGLIKLPPPLPKGSKSNWYKHFSVTTKPLV